MRHPESYTPPVFFTVGGRHYELLTSGLALIDEQPPAEQVYHVFSLMSMSQINTVRPLVLTPPQIEEGHTREDYERCLAYAKEHHYWAMYNSMAEDGYDPKIDWTSLMVE